MHEGAFLHHADYPLVQDGGGGLDQEGARKGMVGDEQV